MKLRFKTSLRGEGKCKFDGADFAEWAESAGVEIVCGEHSPSQFRDAKLVVPSPGVAAAVISKFLPDGNPPEIMAETELAWRQLSGEPVLGVTGTSGKTTTTSLCAAMSALILPVTPVSVTV